MPESCQPNDLAAAAKCFDCIPPSAVGRIIIYLLCQIADMECTPQTLTDAAKCYTCIPQNLIGPITIYLLCQIAQAGTGGGIQCGTVDPTTPPSGNCGIYYNTTDASFFYWDSGAAVWLKFID